MSVVGGTIQGRPAGNPLVALSQQPAELMRSMPTAPLFGASRPGDRFVRFGKDLSDDELGAKLPFHFRPVLDRARKKAQATGSDKLAVEHFVWAIITLLGEQAAELPNLSQKLTAIKGQIQAEEKQADKTPGPEPDKADAEQQKQGQKEILRQKLERQVEKRRLEKELLNKETALSKLAAGLVLDDVLGPNAKPDFAEIVRQYKPLAKALEQQFELKMPVQGLNPRLEPDLKKALSELLQHNDDDNNLATLMRTVRYQGMVGSPSFARVSGLFQQLHGTAPYAKQLKAIDAKSKALGRWVDNALSDSRVARGDQRYLGSPAHLLYHASHWAAAAAHATGAESVSASEDQRLALETLNAFIPPERRSGISETQVFSVLNRLSDQLDKLRNRSTDKLPQASQETALLLRGFVDDPQRLDFSATAFLAYLEEKSGQNPTLKQAIELIRTAAADVGRPVPMPQDLADSFLKNQSMLMHTMALRASKLAQESGSEQVEPKHLLMAMINYAGYLAHLAPPLLVAPASQVRVKQKTEGGEIAARDMRVIVDALLPDDALGKLTIDQVSLVLTRLRTGLEDLQGGGRLTEGDDQGSEETIKMLPLSESLRRVLTALQLGEDPNRKSNDFVRKTLQAMTEVLPGEPDEDSRRVAVLLKSISMKSIGRAVARTEADFKKVLELQRKQPNSAMNDEQYAGIAKLISDMEAANPSGGDKAKFARRLDFLLNKLDWTMADAVMDVLQVQQVLDEDHTGMPDVKTRLLEYTAVQKARRDAGEPPNGRILCLVGPPGVGKTSLATSLGRATGRPTVRIALGGLKREEQLRGHDSTYVGSLAGRIARKIAEAGHMNPIVVLDEIDKVGANELEDAMLELLDPKQNVKFVDNFIGDEVPLDLSKVLFVATANYLHKISEPLRDRMDIIELEGYDETEKLAIAKNHQVDSAIREAGLKPEQMKLTEPGLKTIIHDYTYEEGVRTLERKIKNIASKLALRLQLGQPLPGEIGPSEVRELLGPAEIEHPGLKPARVGSGNGLAVQGSGGSVLRFLCKTSVLNTSNPEAEPIIEFAPGTPSKNMLEMTHDSVHHALNWVVSNRARLVELGFDAEKHKGKRIQLALQTERGGKVDGDSAGAVMTATMVSALTGRKFRNDIAMTGTITILDEVLAIGGLRQKLRGAANAGMRVVFFPEENLKDYHKLSDRQKAELQLMSYEEFKALPDGALPKDKMIVVPTNDIDHILDVVLLPKENTVLPASGNGQGGDKPSRQPMAAEPTAPQFAGRSPSRRLKVIA